MAKRGADSAEHKRCGEVNETPGRGSTTLMIKQQLTTSGMSLPRLLLAIASGAAAVLSGALAVAQHEPHFQPVPSASSVIEPAPSVLPADLLLDRPTIANARAGNIGRAVQPTALPGMTNWSIVPTPNLPGEIVDNLITFTTCVTADDCWAVGYQSAGGVNQTLIQHWDGTAWSIVRSPNTSPDQSNILSSVTCTATDDCWAVGYYNAGPRYNHTLTMHWDGTTWSIVPSPNPLAEQDSVFFDVTCVSASDCWAVGIYREPAPAIGPQRTMIQHWDGNSWTIVPSQNGLGTLNSSITGVTCTASNDCWAVGWYTNDVAVQTLIQRWDGTAWTTVPSANTSPLHHSVLTSVTCTAVNDCWAVGFQAPTQTDAWETFTQHWNGIAWTLVLSPNVAGRHESYLYEVSCSSSSECFAVGFDFDGATYHTLILRWNGAAWAIVSSPDANPTFHNFLYSVTCIPGGTCQAAGAYFPEAPTYQTMMQRWNGSTWELLSSPNAPRALSHHLIDVSCSSANDCWAVGFVDVGTGYIQTLTLRWNGTTWSVVESPNSSATEFNLLSGVTCSSADDCWAVGYHFTGGRPQSLLLRWNGIAWSIVPAPTSPANGSHILRDVHCTSDTNCRVVGNSQSGGVNRTLALHWNGIAWSVEQTPNSGTGNNSFNAIDCSAADDCWAVGRVTAAGVTSPLLQRWNGEAWSIAATPATDRKLSIVSDVSCTSASDCWAVGHQFSGDGTAFEPLFQKWDGTVWTQIAAPASPDEDQTLAAVSCASASDCRAVGQRGPDGSANRTLIQEWNGTSWSVVESPTISATQNHWLEAVTCDAINGCWAVGDYNLAGSVYQTLALKRAAAPLPLSATAVSRKVHGSAGVFDIELPLTGSPGIECRSGGTDNTHQIIFEFTAPVTVGGATVTTDAGKTAAINEPLGTSSDGKHVTVNLTNVSNAQTLTIKLIGVSDGASTQDFSVSLDVLLGDTNATRSVDGNDVSAVQARTRQGTNSTNFRMDVNATGLIDGNDVSTTQSRTRTRLP
jgi:hypothetical protein